MSHEEQISFFRIDNKVYGQPYNKSGTTAFGLC